MNNIYESINQLYDKAGYLARHGGDLYVTFFAIIIFLLIVGYFSFMAKIKPIKANWVKERCNPTVIPYAGLVYKAPGQSFFEATAENFAQCGQTVLRNIAGYATMPLYYVLNVLMEVFIRLTTMLAGIRELFNRMRNNLQQIISDIMGRLLNIVIPIQTILIAAKSAFEKFAGICTTIIYALYGYFLSLKAFLGSIVKILIVFMVMLTAFIILMWILPITWPVAASLTVTWATLMIVLIVTAVFMAQVMKQPNKKKMPKKPKK